MALVYDLADPQELNGYIRAAADEANLNRFVLSQFLPNDNIDEISFRIPRGTLADQDAAEVRAWDTESPIASRQGIERILGELPPISRKIRLGEEERLRKRALERGNNNELVSKIYDDAANLARAVAARLELFRGEALVDGQIAINENGFVQTVDFGRSSDMEPTALAGGNLWSAHSTAVPITDLVGWKEDYRDKNGIDPAVMVTSTTVLGHLLRNAEIVSIAQSLNGTPSLVSRGQLNNVLQSFDLPPIVTYDVKVRVAGSQVRVIDEDKLLFLPPANEPLGKTFFATTAEALELQGAQQISQDEAPGMVSVVEKTFDPVATWTKVTAIGLPILVNPDLVLVADVLT